MAVKTVTTARDQPNNRTHCLVEKGPRGIRDGSPEQDGQRQLGGTLEAARSQIRRYGVRDDNSSANVSSKKRHPQSVLPEASKVTRKRSLAAVELRAASREPVEGRQADIWDMRDANKHK